MNGKDPLGLEAELQQSQGGGGNDPLGLEAELKKKDSTVSGNPLKQSFGNFRSKNTDELQQRKTQIKEAIDHPSADALQQGVRLWTGDMSANDKAQADEYKVKYAQVKPELDEATAGLQKNPGDVNLLNHVAERYAYIGDNDAALNFYAQANAKGDNERALKGMARIYTQNNTPEAKQAWEDVQKINPQSGEAALNLARLYTLEGKTTESDKELQGMNNSYALNLKATNAKKRGDDTSANAHAAAAQLAKFQEQDAVRIEQQYREEHGLTTDESLMVQNPSYKPDDSVNIADVLEYPFRKLYEAESGAIQGVGEGLKEIYEASGEAPSMHKVLRAVNGVATTVFSGAMLAAPHVNTAFHMLPEDAQRFIFQPIDVLAQLSPEDYKEMSANAQLALQLSNTVASIAMVGGIHKGEAALKPSEVMADQSKLSELRKNFSESTIADVNKAQEILDKMPEGLSDDKKVEIAPLISEKEKLEAQKGNLDEAFHPAQDAKIEELTKKIQDKSGLLEASGLEKTPVEKKVETPAEPKSATTKKVTTPPAEVKSEVKSVVPQEALDEFTKAMNEPSLSNLTWKPTALTEEVTGKLGEYKKKYKGKDEEAYLKDFAKAFAESELPKKKFGVKRKIELSELPDENINIRPVEQKVKPIEQTTEAKRASLKNITSDDSMRPNMTGVFHDAEKGVLVATDSYKMVIVPDKNIKETGVFDAVTGKKIESDKKYPNYEAVIPTDQPYKTKVNVQQWLNETTGLQRTAGFFEKPIHAKIKIGDAEYVFSPEQLQPVLKVFAEHGVKDVEIGLSAPNRAMSIEGGGIKAIVMPVLAEAGKDRTKTLLERAETPKEREVFDEAEHEREKAAIERKIAYTEKEIARYEKHLSETEDGERGRNYYSDRIKDEKNDLEKYKEELKTLEDGRTRRKTTAESESAEPVRKEPDTESSVKDVERKAESADETELNEAVTKADELLEERTPAELLAEDIAAYKFPSKIKINEQEFIRGKGYKTIDKVVFPEQMKTLRETLSEAIQNPSAKAYDAFYKAFNKAYESPFKGSEAVQKVWKETMRAFPEIESWRKSEPGKIVGSKAVSSKVATSKIETSPIPSEKRTSIKDISDYLSKQFNIPIRTGKVRWGERLGIYKPHYEVARIKHETDLGTIAHEVAHHLDKKYFKSGFTKGSSVFKPWKKELGELDYDNKKKRPYEGFAEFMRHYLTGDTAQQLAPNFYDFFVNDFLKKNPEVAETLQETKAKIDTWRQQGSEARILSDIDFDGKKPSTTLGERWTSFMQRMIDSNYPLKKIMDDILTEKNISRQEYESELGWKGKDPYELASAVSKTAPAKVRSMAKYGLTDFAGNKVFKPLKEILDPVKKDLDSAVAYAYSLRVLYRYAKGHEFLPNKIEDARFVADKYKDNADYNQFAADVTKWNAHFIEYLADASRLSDEAKQKILDSDVVYLPMKKVVDAAMGAGGSKRFVELGQPVRRFIGKEGQIINPLEAMIQNAERIVNVADRTRVVNSLLDLSKTHEGIGKFIEPVSTPLKSTKVQIEQIKKQLEDAGADLTDADMEGLLTIFSQSNRMYGENIVPVYRDGKLQFYQVHPELFNVLKGIDNTSMRFFNETIIGKVISAPTKMVRLGATGIRAGFQLITNPFRDQFTALMQTMNSSLGIPARSVGAIKDLWKGALKEDIVRRFKTSGVEMAQPLGIDRKFTQNLLQDILADDKKSKAMNIVKHPIEALREIMSAPEKMPRYAEFKKVWNKYNEPLQEAYRTGDFEKVKELENARMVDATNQANEITLNFKKMGAYAQVLNQLIFGFNPAIRGIAKMSEMFEKQPVKTFLRGAAYITAPTLALYALNKDEDWYKNLPAWEKSLFWHFKVGNEIMRLPKPFEWGFLFSNIPEAIAQNMSDGDIQHYKDMAQQGVNILMPSLIPDAIKPAAESYFNWDFFRDKPIISKSQQDLLPYLQYTDNTSEVAKTAGKILNVSPDKIDHLLSGYTGGLARDILNSMPKAHKELADLPVIGRLFVRHSQYLGSGDYTEKFYDYYTKVRQLEVSAKKMEREKIKMTDEQESILSYKRDIRGTATKLKELRDKADEIVKSDIPKPVKDKLLDAVGYSQYLLAKEMVAKIRGGKKPAVLIDGETAVPEGEAEGDIAVPE